MYGENFVILSASEESYKIDRYSLYRSPLYQSRVNVARRRFFASAQNDKCYLI